MELAQVVNYTAPHATYGFSGVSGPQLFWIVLIIGAIIIGFLLLSTGTDTTRYRGTKGGSVKKTTTEYEEFDDDDEL